LPDLAAETMKIAMGRTTCVARLLRLLSGLIDD
jgi:hypothetical protein